MQEDLQSFKLKTEEEVSGLKVNYESQLNMATEDHSSRIQEMQEGFREFRQGIRKQIDEIDKKVRIQSRVSSKEQLLQSNNPLAKYRRQIAATAGASSHHDQSVSKMDSETSLHSIPRQTQEFIEKMVN